MRGTTNKFWECWSRQPMWKEMGIAYLPSPQKTGHNLTVMSKNCFGLNGDSVRCPFYWGGELGCAHFVWQRGMVHITLNLHMGCRLQHSQNLLVAPSHLVQLTRVRLSGNFKTFINRSILKNFAIIFLKKKKIY